MRRTPPNQRTHYLRSGVAVVTALTAAVLLWAWAAVYAQAPVGDAEAPGRTPAAAAPAAPAPADADTPDAAPAPAASGEVLRVRVDSIIHPVIAEFLRDAVGEADAEGAAALVVELSTPGGLMTSTRDILTALAGAATPVVVYVAPSGAQAASAGFFILMAADVAAMAPGTNTGAAHPVGGGGEDIEGTMGEKVEQDAAATIRSLAERHGRDAALAEAAVVESRSFSADEALAGGLVDVVAASLPALLTEIDGRTVEKGGKTRTLATASAPVRDLEMPVLKRILSALAHPNIAYMLLSLGGLGLLLELYNPGAILPGVLGAIFLIMAFFGLSVLPVSYAGVALILLAIVLFIAEIKVTSFGLLTVGGVVSLVLGSIMLIDSPEPAMRVSYEVVGGVCVFALIMVGLLTTLVVRAHRALVRTGADGLLQRTGRAYTDLTPRGKVFIQGEIWDAVSERPVARDATVQVTAVEGLLLRVRPHGAADETPVPMRSHPETPEGGASP